MVRNKLYSMINILGLSVGIACCLLLSLYVQDELSFDAHFSDSDRIYRLTTVIKNESGIEHRLAATSQILAQGLKETVPEIEVASRTFKPFWVDQIMLRKGEESIYESFGYVADSTLFDIFDYQFIEGTPKGALTHPNTVVLTDGLASKMFGDSPALDQIITIEFNGIPSEFKITGVIASDKNTHLDANFYASINSPSMARVVESMTSWVAQNISFIYFKLREGADVANVTTKMNEVLMERGGKEMEQFGFGKTLALQPLEDIHLKSNFDFIETSKLGNITYVYVLASIAAIILLLACINFMNLATAKASQRAGEVGVRKALGADRKKLIFQFLGESLLIVTLSIALCILWIELILPYFNYLTGKNMDLNGDNVQYLVLALLGITIFTGIFSGSYPAFYLSSFEPVKALKSQKSQERSLGMLRKTLVVFQFVISIGLVSGVIIITEQLNYMRDKNPGFTAESRIVVPFKTTEAARQFAAFKDQTLKNSFVTSAGGINDVPGPGVVLDDLPLFPDGSNAENAIVTRMTNVDQHIFKTLGIKLIAGRGYSDNLQTEKNKIIINRTAVESYNLTVDDAVGKFLNFDTPDSLVRYEIVGIIDDYHQHSLRQPISPMGFRATEFGGRAITAYSNLVVAINTEDHEQAVAGLQAAWKDMINDTPFEYYFLDDSVLRLYEQDKRVSQIITSFTLLAIFISCLGLYALSLFVAERRVKEVGIRKVLGASVPEIVILISKDFAKLVGIAIIISIPVAWWAMDQWLESFAFRINIDATVFVISGLFALLLAWVTVSYQSFKAARTNPTDTLKMD